MTWQQLDAPPYDHLFSTMANTFHEESRSKQIYKISHYFYDLRHYNGMKKESTLRAFHHVMGELSQVDPGLCKHILEQELPSVGMKTVSNICAKHGIELDLEVVFAALPAWTKRLQRMNIGQEPESRRIATFEIERGIMVEGQVESLYTRLLFAADTEQKQKVLKSYFNKCALHPADFQALCLHKQYQPSMRKILKLSGIGSNLRDYDSQLLGLALSGNLDYERLDKASQKEGFRTAGLSVVQLFDDRPGVRVDGYELGLCLTNGGSALSTPARMLFVGLAIDRYLQKLSPQGQKQFADKLLRALKDSLADAVQSGLGPSSLITRAITQVALMGVTQPFERMVDFLLNTPFYDDDTTYPWLWITKHGVFGNSLWAEESVIMSQAGQSGRDYLIANGVTRSLDDKGRNVLTHPAPALENLPQALDRCLGDLIVKIVCTPYKKGYHLTPDIAQKMVDLDVLTDEHLQAISQMEKAVKSLCRADLPKKVMERLPDQMRVQVLEHDLGL